MDSRKLFCLLVLAPLLAAGDLVVAVSGASAGKASGKEGKEGEVGCALYRSAEGFPMNPTKAVAAIWVKAAPLVECRFKDVAPGPFAVAVSFDWNGNRKTDKNILGIPTEPWGVSNNVRPSMRPPRFDEASGKMPPDGDLRIEIQVAK